MTLYPPPPPHTYLVFIHRSTKGPHCCKHKVQFVPLLGAVGRGVGRREEGLKEVAESLNHTLLRHWCDLLEAMPQAVQAWWHIAVKEDGEVGFLRLYFTLVNPAGHISTANDTR